MSDQIAAIEALYSQLPARPAFPFIGTSFSSGRASDLRVRILGTNTYLSSPAGDHEVNEGSWRAWFSEGTFNYHRVAFLEADLLARVLCSSDLFAGSTYAATRPRSHMFATNLIKAYTGAEYTTASAIPSALLKQHARVWHRELDMLALADRLPHVLVVFGRVLWEHVWRAFCPEDRDSFPAYDHLRVGAYHVAGAENADVYHHANRVHLASRRGDQPMLMILLDHPAARDGRPRDASWRLRQRDFRRLAGLPIAEIPEIEPSTLPRPDASWDEIARFALTFDGYRWAGSFDECARISHSGRSATVDELRNALFFAQRADRHTGWEPDPATIALRRSWVATMRERTT